MDKRIAYSQNFLINKTLIAELIEKSSITENDVVCEIGAGNGTITEELLKKAKGVIAFELDNDLFTKLVHKFQSEKKLELKRRDFLDYDLPNTPYKVFSNPPFNITSEIIKKLTLSGKPPEEAYLILQNEAAQKFVGKPYARINSLVSILLKPWFDLEIIYKFKHGDFSPRPNVETVLLRITRNHKPALDYKQKRLYEDFVTYVFNGSKPLIVKNSKPSDLNFEEWLNISSDFLNRSNHSGQNLVRGSYAKMLKQQEALEKVHRTRVDKNWRKFAKERPIAPIVIGAPG